MPEDIGYEQWQQSGSPGWGWSSAGGWTYNGQPVPEGYSPSNPPPSGDINPPTPVASQQQPVVETVEIPSLSVGTSALGSEGAVGVEVTYPDITPIDYVNTSPAQLSTLSPDNVKYIPPDQLAQMSVAQIAAITDKGQLTPEQYAALSQHQKAAVLSAPPQVSPPEVMADFVVTPTYVTPFNGVEGLNQGQIDTLNAMVNQGKSHLELSNYLNAQGIDAISPAFGIAHTVQTYQSGGYVGKEVQGGSYSVLKPDGTYEVYSKDTGVQTYQKTDKGWMLVTQPIQVTPDMVYKFTIPENGIEVKDAAGMTIGYKDQQGVTWWTPDSTMFKQGYMNDQTRGASPIEQGLYIKLANGTPSIISQDVIARVSQLGGEKQFNAYQSLGIYGAGDKPIYKDGQLAGVIPEEKFNELSQRYKNIYEQDGYQEMAEAIQKDALSVSQINKYGSVDNYIRESTSAGVDQGEIANVLMSAMDITKEQAASLIDVGKYNSVENYIISSINNGVNAEAIKNTLSSAGYINVNDAVDSMALLMASLPTMPEDLRDGFNSDGIDGYKNVLSQNYTVLPDGQYIENTRLEQLKTDSPDYYRIATDLGMGTLLSQIDHDTKLQATALGILEDKGYRIDQPQLNAIGETILQAMPGADKLAKYPEAPVVPQYDIQKFIEENPTQDSVRVLSAAFGSDSDVAKNAQEYVDYLNNIVGYLDKNVNEDTLPSSFGLAVGRAIDKSGYPSAKVEEMWKQWDFAAERSKLKEGGVERTLAQQTWDGLSDGQKLDVAKLYMEDPYKDNLFSSLVAEYDYAYSKLPTVAKVALPLGVAALGFIAAPLAIAGMALFTADAVAHTVAPLTISNKTLTYQIDQNGKYFATIQSSEGLNSVVNDYLSKAIKSVTGETATNPIEAYQALSAEDKAKVDAEYTRNQLGLEPSAMQYVLSGGMIVASAIPLIGGAIKGIAGTAGAIGRGSLIGAQVGLTGMFIGTSVPTILNPKVEVSDKITAIAFDVMMLHGMGKMAGVDKALSSASGIAKSLITGKGLPERALSVSKGDIYRARVPEEFVSAVDRIQNKLEGIRDTVYSDKLSVDQKIAAVKEVLSPEDFATVKKLIDYVDNIQKQKTTAADYDNFDFTVVKNANEKIGTANNELKSYFEENGLGVYGSTVEYLFKGSVKGMKPGDFDVRVFLDSGLKDRAKIASDVAEILKKNGVDAQVSGNSVKVNGEKVFDIHTWNEKFNAPSLMPFGWKQKGYIVKDGVRLVPIEEQAASRVKSIFDKAAIEGTIGTKPGELGVLLPEQLKVSEAQRTYDNSKIVMRLNDLLAKSEAYFKDKGDLSKANDIKEIVDILSKPTTTEPILSAEEQIRMQENEFGTVENYRAEVAKAQREALEYWDKGGEGAYTHKTELGEITINPTPINEVMPNTLFTVTGEGTSFIKGLELDGKVVSGKVIENRGAELTVPHTTADGKPIEVNRKTYAYESGNVYYRGESSAPNAHIGDAFYYTNSLKGARMWGDKAVTSAARKGVDSEIVIDGAILEPKNPFTINQGTLTNLASGKADIPSLGLYGKDIAKLGVNRGSIEFNEIVAKAAKSKGYDALKVLIDEKYAAEPGEHYIAVLDEAIIKAPLSSMSKVDLAGAKIIFDKNGKPITNDAGLVAVDIGKQPNFTKPSEMKIDEVNVKEVDGVLTGDKFDSQGRLIETVEAKKHPALGGDVRRRITAIVVDTNKAATGRVVPEADVAPSTYDILMKAYETGQLKKGDRILLVTDRKEPHGYYGLAGGGIHIEQFKAMGKPNPTKAAWATDQVYTEVGIDIVEPSAKSLPAYLGQVNRHSQASYVIKAEADINPSTPGIDVNRYRTDYINEAKASGRQLTPDEIKFFSTPEAREGVWFDFDPTKIQISKQTPTELLTARDMGYYKPKDLGVGGVEKNFDIYYKGDGKAYISAEDAGILLREVSGGIDAGKWITNKYEAVDKKIPIFTSDELAYNYLRAKYGDNIPSDAAVIAVRIDAKNDVGATTSTKTSIHTDNVKIEDAKIDRNNNDISVELSDNPATKGYKLSKGDTHISLFEQSEITPDLLRALENNKSTMPEIKLDKYVSDARLGDKETQIITLENQKEWNDWVNKIRKEVGLTGTQDRLFHITISSNKNMGRMSGIGNINKADINPSSELVHSLDAGKLIEAVNKIQYDHTTDGAKPVIENELTVKVGGELLKTPKTELSDKYGIDSGVTETKDINTGKTYKVLWLATENAIKAGYGYTPTASQVRTASFLALKGMFSDILHPHKPSDIIFTDETKAARGTLFDLFHVDKIKFKADDGAFKSAKEIRDAVIKEDNVWLEKAAQVIKDKIKLLHEDESGFIKLYGKEEAVKLKEVVEGKKSSDYVDYVRNEKDKLQAKEIEDKLNQNKEVKDYLDKISADTKAHLLTVNLAELTRPFMINTGNTLADVQESSNLYNLDTIGAYGEVNTSPLSVAPVVSEDKATKPVKDEITEPVLERIEVPEVVEDAGISDIPEVSEAPESKAVDWFEISPIKDDFFEISPVETDEIEPIEPTDVVPVEESPVEPVEPTEITPIEPIEPTPIEPIETTPIEPIETTPIEPTEVTPIEPTDITPIETPDVTEVEETEIPEPPDIPEPPEPPRPPPPKTVIPTLSEDEIPKELKNQKGIITWRQGNFWEAVPPPYDKVYHLTKPLPGTYKFATGKGSAYKTLQVIGGRPEKDVYVDLGWADITIKHQDGDLTMSFGGGKEAVEQRWEDEAAEAEANRPQVQYIPVPYYQRPELSQYERESYDGEVPDGEVSEKIPKGLSRKVAPPIGLQKIELPQYQDGRVKVYLVNGEYVRNEMSKEYPDAIEFTQGGHSQVYDYIPKNEVWIDKANSLLDRKATLLHELREFKIMSEGKEYEDAHHEDANPLELEGRHDLSKLDELIAAELDDNRERRSRKLKPPKEPEEPKLEDYTLVQYLRSKHNKPRAQEVNEGKIADRYYLGRRIENTVSQ